MTRYLTQPEFSGLTANAQSHKYSTSENPIMQSAYAFFYLRFCLWGDGSLDYDLYNEKDEELYCELTPGQEIELLQLLDEEKERRQIQEQKDKEYWQECQEEVDKGWWYR